MQEPGLCRFVENCMQLQKLFEPVVFDWAIFFPRDSRISNKKSFDRVAGFCDLPNAHAMSFGLVSHS